MRITYIHQYFNTPSMSGGTRSFEMARRLVKEGHEVTVITACRDKLRSSPYITNESGIKVHWIPMRYTNNMSFLRRGISFVGFAIKAVKASLKYSSDVVFATSTPLTVCIPGYIASRFNRCPMVFEVRDLWPEMPIAVGAINNKVIIYLAKKLEKFAYRSSRFIIALSPGMRDGVVATGIIPQKVAVIPNSCDIDLFTTISESKYRQVLETIPSIPVGSKVILYAGTLGRLNNVLFLVELAENRLKSSDNVHFLVIGDGSEREKIEQAAREKGVLGVNLHMLTRVPKSDMPYYYSRADIVCSLFSDIKEMQHNSANKFFDTLAASKPILINYGGWQYNLVGNYKCGLNLHKLTASQGNNLISELLLNKDEYYECCRNSGLLASKYFSRDVLFSQFHEVLVRAVDTDNTLTISDIANGDYL